MAKNSGWWDEFFPAFRPFFGMLSQKATNRHVRYVVDKLNLKPGEKFLDCPCGIGRIALPLAKKGIKVTGVDITRSYLDELGRKAAGAGLEIDLHKADMRRINFDSGFDAAGNLWTSFGYFSKESDNLLALKKMYNALKPGGRFMLHVINRDWIMAHYRATDWQEVTGIKSLERRHFDYATSTNHGQWCIIKDGREGIYDISIRMYSFHELIAMFKEVGFIDIEGFGSERNEPISSERQMMFVIGAKPGRRSNV